MIDKTEYYDDNTPFTNADMDKLNKFLEAGDINSASKLVAKFLRTKMYGVDVRESLAQWVLITAQITNKMIQDNNSFEIRMNSRQQEVERRQDDLLGQWNQAVTALTKDSEVILARDSSYFGVFNILDDRLEFIESLISKYVPAGFNITIKHNQGRNPKVVVDYYEYAIGTEPNGLAMGPEGSFGGINNQEVPCQVDYPDSDTSIVHIPLSFMLKGEVKFDGGYWYLIDGYKTLRFDLGEINSEKAKSGNGSNETSADAAPTKPINLLAPFNLTEKSINDNTKQIEWEDKN
jgi:hypothetical protein